MVLGLRKVGWVREAISSHGLDVPEVSGLDPKESHRNACKSLQFGQQLQATLPTVLANHASRLLSFSTCLQCGGDCPAGMIRMRRVSRLA